MPHHTKTDPSPAAHSPGAARGAARAADGAGVLGAVFAALCCAGVPVVVGALSAVGLSFLRTDAILLPLLAVSLAVALWGLAKGRAVHGSAGPLVVGAVGSVVLAAAVLAVRPLLWIGTVLLIAAVAWNVVARRRPRSLRPA